MNSRWAFRILASFIAFALLSGIVSAPISFAADSEVQVLVGDMCPNIPGNQPVVPNGMQIDENGSCYTPAPPPPVDACPNIDGYQAAIPQGHYRNPAGNCVPQSKPPQDVCPNITGIQSDVPEGMQTSNDGSCVAPPVDVCPNITGPQPVLPDGMLKDDAGDCYTPNGATPTEPTGPHNTPTILKPIANPLLKLVPDWLKTLVRNAPVSLAKALPYYLIGLIVVITLLLLIQTLRESSATKNILIFFRRKKELAEEKDSFIALSAHYLRSTLTAMQSSLASAIALRELTEEAVRPLAGVTKTLQLDIESLLESSESNTERERANAIDRTSIRIKTLRSLLFWIPLTTIALLVMTTDFLFSALRGIDLGRNNLWAQCFSFLVASFMLYTILRVRHTHHIERKNAEQLMKNEQAIDTVRSQFIQQTTAILESGLTNINDKRSVIVDAPSTTVFEDGYSGLASILDRFRLLVQTVDSSTVQTKSDVRDLLNNALLQQQAASDEKKLTLTDTATSHELHVDRFLVGSVINNVIETIIRLSAEGSNITIATSPVSHGIEITIKSSDAHISDDTLVAVFAPIPDAHVNPSPDLGLFLDKIIMTYLGGTITAEAVPPHAVAIRVRV